VLRFSNSIGALFHQGIRKHQVGIRPILVTHGLHTESLFQAEQLQDLLPGLASDFSCRPLISRRWAWGTIDFYFKLARKGRTTR